MSKTDSGIYRCQPYNLHGSSGRSTEINVQVVQPVVFNNVPNEEYFVEIGSSLKVTCDAVGIPKPNVVIIQVCIECVLESLLSYIS